MSVDFNLNPDLVKSEGHFAALLSKVIEYIREIETLRAITHVFREDEQTLDNDLQKALSDLNPISIMVTLGTWKDTSSVHGTMILDPIEIICTVFENVNLNRGESGTRITCNRVIELLGVHLKGERVASAFLNRPQGKIPANNFGATLAKSIVFVLSTAVSRE
jgi:hypothetical protein